MKITLIRYHDRGNINTRLPASLNKVRGVLPPLGIAYIAAYLRSHGHIVNIIDAVADNLTGPEVRRKLDEFSPELVGISAMTSTLPGSLEAARIAKDYGAKVVVGGPHLSAYPEETLSYDYIDFGILGEGEIPFYELTEALEGKKAYKDVRGLIYRENGKIFRNGHFILKDLNVLPTPAYDLLPLAKYTSIISSKAMTTMITARGCPYQCGYCFSQPQDKVYRTINPKTVVDQIEELMKKYRIKELMFYDDTIALKRDHIEEICCKIIKRGLKIRWESPCRVDNIDFSILSLMAKSGCFRLRFGVESGNQEILKLMNKRITLKQVNDAFDWCHQLGIETFAYFMIGYANENSETINDTINLAKQINPDFVMFTIATPYPHTHLYELAKKSKLFEGDYWRDFSLSKKSERLPYLVKDSEFWVKKAYREFYLRPFFILKKIFKIRSFDDLRNMFKAAHGLLFFKVKEE